MSCDEADHGLPSGTPGLERRQTCREMPQTL